MIFSTRWVGWFLWNLPAFADCIGQKIMQLMKWDFVCVSHDCKMICERGMLCFCYQPTHHPLTPHFAIVQCAAMQVTSKSATTPHNAVQFVICAKMQICAKRPYNAINVFCAVPSVFITVDQWTDESTDCYINTAQYSSLKNGMKRKQNCGTTSSVLTGRTLMFGERRIC